MNVLLCSCDPLLIKNLYGALRQEGYGVTQTEWAATAVKMTFTDKYDAVVIDAEDVGMSANQVAEIVKRQREDTVVLAVGNSNAFLCDTVLTKPLDVQRVLDILRGLGKVSLTS
jgi:DNA-binding response OmpR family regulator